MQPSRARLVCRSHNPFTPSIALWQHFVLANRPFLHQHRQCLSSSAASEAEPSATPAPETNAPPPTPLDRSEPNDSLEHGENRRSVIRRIASSRRSPAAVREITDVLAKGDPGDSVTLMAKTKCTFDNNADYEGVVVQPMLGKRHVPESTFPWALTRKERREMEGMKRWVMNLQRRKPMLTNRRQISH